MKKVIFALTALMVALSFTTCFAMEWYVNLTDEVVSCIDHDDLTLGIEGYDIMLTDFSVIGIRWYTNRGEGWVSYGRPGCEDAVIFSDSQDALVKAANAFYWGWCIEIEKNGG